MNTQLAKARTTRADIVSKVRTSTSQLLQELAALGEGLAAPEAPGTPPPPMQDDPTLRQQLTVR